MNNEKKRTAPAATGNGPSNPDEGHARIIAPDSLEAQAMKALQKAQEEQDRRAMGDIAKAFTREEWQIVLHEVPTKVLLAELDKRATRGEELTKKMVAIYEEETAKWK